MAGVEVLNFLYQGEPPKGRERQAYSEHGGDGASVELEGRSACEADAKGDIKEPEWSDQEKRLGMAQCDEKRERESGEDYGKRPGIPKDLLRCQEDQGSQHVLCAEAPVPFENDLDEVVWREGIE